VTGRTETIHGIEGEERLIDMTLGGPALPNMPPGPMMHMVMHVWLAKASETARVAALGELAKWDFMSYGGMDPVSVLTKAFAQMPGMGDSVLPMMQEIRSSRRVVLRMQIEMYMPLLAMVQQMAAGGSPTPASGPEKPSVSMTHEVSEISTDPVPASAFQVPEGYQAQPAVDLLNDMMKRQVAATGVTPPK
jgi:hypothetical protein